MLLGLAQMVPYTIDNDLGSPIGGTHFLVREGAGTDEALKWEMFMQLHAMGPPAGSRKGRAR